MIKFIDLFAGIGGIRTGFENQGFDCVMSSEIDKSCQKTYFDNFNEIPLGDITNIDSKTIPTYDILCAGFPCQPFSICGKQAGFNDTRGTLFFEICRIIKDTNPKVIFLENVKNIIYHDKGNTLKVIVETLKSLGYYVEHKILNGSDFGLPQNRERIASKEKSFEFSKLTYSKKVILNDFLDVNGDFEYLQESEYSLIENLVMQKSGLLFAGYRNKNSWKKDITLEKLKNSSVHRQTNRIYSTMGLHPTLSSQEISGRFFIYLPNKNKLRKLTLRECYRIMGFGDNFIINKTKSKAYHQVGNSVCITMVSAIAKEIKNQFFMESL